MQNELPKIDIPVDCVAGTDITKELLNLYTDSPCRLKAGIFVLLLDGDIEASINLVRYKIQPMSFITILPQSILQIHKANGNLRIYFIGFSSHFLEILIYKREILTRESVMVTKMYHFHFSLKLLQVLD